MTRKERFITMPAITAVLFISGLFIYTTKKLYDELQFSIECNNFKYELLNHTFGYIDELEDNIQSPIESAHKDSIDSLLNRCL